MNLKSLIFAAFALLMITAVSCKDDDAGETEEQRNNRQISTTWTIDEVNIIDAGSQEAYDGYTTGASSFTVTDAQTFNVSGAANLPEMVNPMQAVPANGSFAFGSNFQTAMLTSGNTTLNISITELTDNSLIFTYQGTLGKETEVVTVEIVASN